MNIIVTGSSGALGSFFSDRFTQAGNKVFGIDITPGNSKHFEQFFLGSVLDDTFMRGVSNYILNNRIQIDAVINTFYHPESDYADAREKFELMTRKELLWEAFSGYSASDFAKEFELNVAGLHNVNRFILALTRQRSCKIINMGSVLATRQPNPIDLEFQDRFRYKAPGYSVSKSAVVAYTEYCANLFAGTDLRFNTVVAGFVRRDSSPESLEFEKRITKRMSIKRFANPEEIYSLVEFLISDRADYITGQHFVVDGGFSVS